MAHKGRTVAAVAVGIACAALIVINAWAFIVKGNQINTDAASSGGTGENSFWKQETALDKEQRLSVSVQEAVLGDSEDRRKLEVFVQKVSDVTKYTDSGFLHMKLTQKSQYLKYSGTAIYTVDLRNIDENHVSTDPENQTVTILIPHVEEDLDLDEEETQAEETIHEGIFSLGDLKLTPEQMQEVELSVRNEMEEKLKEEKVKENADRLARMQVWEIYQPVVSKVAPGYAVVVEFEKNKTTGQEAETESSQSVDTGTTAASEEDRQTE